MLRKIKDIAIVVDFVATMVGVAIQKSNPDAANVLMMYIGGIALVVAFFCVIIGFFSKSRIKR